jgi:hypothetical protein
MLAEKFDEHFTMLLSVTQTFDDHLAACLLSVNDHLACFCLLMNSMNIWLHLAMLMSVTQTFDDHLAALLSVDEFDDHFAFPMLAYIFDDHLALLLSVD